MHTQLNVTEALNCSVNLNNLVMVPYSGKISLKFFLVQFVI